MTRALADRISARRASERPTLDKVFALLEAKVLAGERCPVSSGPDADPNCPSAMIRTLAHGGKIAIEISSRNWRRVTILVGPHAGKSTAPNPDAHARTYQTLDMRGSVVNGRFTDTGASKRQQPSAPRFLMREELE